MGFNYELLPINVKESTATGKRLGTGVHDKWQGKLHNDRVHLCDISVFLNKDGTGQFSTNGASTDGNQHVQISLWLSDAAGEKIVRFPGLMDLGDNFPTPIPEYWDYGITGGLSHDAPFGPKFKYPKSLYDIIENVALRFYIDGD